MIRWEYDRERPQPKRTSVGTWWHRNRDDIISATCLILIGVVLVWGFGGLGQ